MPAESADTASSLDDYLDLLEALSDLGVESVVIGGCAVGAYARLLGESVFSRDLDLFVTQRALESVVADGAAIGVRIQKLPSPRSIPVALLDWRGREVNLITATEGLPPPDVEARAAREFQLGEGRDLTVLIADPFDLLRNKLAVNRPKDQPHIALLRRFLDEEVVHAFVVLKSADGLADGDWMTKLASWPHRPYLVDGTPNPYCYPIRMAVRSDQ